MTSKELRLGNFIWYLHEESESIKTVDLRILEQIVYNENDPDDSEDRFARFGFNYAPIPLTEEWLKRMGFENDSYSNFRKYLNDEFKEQYLTVSFSDYDCKDYSSTGFSDFDLIADCKYVHSLQNLYYSLTGEDLEVK